MSTPPAPPRVGPRSRSPLTGAAALAAVLAASAAAAAPPPGGDRAFVQIADEKVLSLRVGRAGESAEERARAASRALERAAEESQTALSQVEVHEGAAAVRVGRVTVLEVGPEDVAAEGAVGLEPLAQSYASQIDRALKTERRRASVSGWVFDFSLLVFSGLVAFLLLGKISELERRAEAWMRERPGRVPALRLRGVELVSGEAMAGALAIFLRIGRYLFQLVVAYGWVVFGLSLFPATRGAGMTLGRLVLGPAANLLSRVGAALPLLLGALIAGAVLWLALRAIRLLFQSVADGETHVAWLKADLAVPIGELVRLGLVVLAAVFAAPILTGSQQGVLAHVGTAALAAVALGLAPTIANVAVGLPRLLGRTYRTGHLVEVGRAIGVVRAVDLLHVELEDASGGRVLVPHLAGLASPTRLPRSQAAFHLDLAVDPAEDQGRVRGILLDAGGPGTTVHLTRLDAAGAVYRVAGPGPDLASRVADALRSSGVRLGHVAALGPAGTP